MVEKDLVDIQNEDTFTHAVRQLFENKGIEKKTELKRSEVNKLAFLYAIAERYDFTDLKNILDKFLELRISIDRKGRKEVVDIARAITDLEAMKQSLNVESAKKDKRL